MMAWRVFLALLLLFVATAANAETEAVLDLEGYIPEICEIRTEGVGDALSLNIKNLSGAERVSTTIGIFCNVPMSGFIRSESGRLINENFVQADEAPDEAQVPYKLSIRSPKFGVHGPYRGESLINGQTITTRETDAIFNDNLLIQLQPDQSSAIYSGVYSDKIYLSLTPLE